MRLLHVISSLDPRVGGTVEAVRAFSTEQARQGHAVTVLTLDAPGQTYFDQFTVPLIALGPSHLGFSYNRRLAPWMREHGAEYDAVVLHGIWEYAVLGSWRGLRDGATPWFLCPHGMLDPYFEQFRLKHIKKVLYWRLWLGRIFREATAVLYTAQEEQRLGERSFTPYAARNVVAPLGTAPPDAAEANEASAFLQRFPELANCRIALFLGRNDPKKGLDIAIGAVAALAAAFTDLRLVVAAANEEAEEQRLNALATKLGVRDRVVWTGFLTGLLKSGAMAAAGLFVLPSHGDNFALAAVESMARGLPIAITKKVNIWREVERYEAGFVDDDTVEGTARSMRRWLAMTPDQWRHMSQNARRCFAECFEISAAARHVVEQIERRIAETRAS
jgi:glycosyltransferase involved in cell wall biosynthesis